MYKSMETKKIVQSIQAPDINNYWFDLNDNKLKRFTSKGWEPITSSGGGDIPSDVYSKDEVDNLLTAKASVNSVNNALNAISDANTRISNEVSNSINRDEKNLNLITANTDSINKITLQHTEDMATVTENLNNVLEIAKNYTDSVASGAMHWKGVVNDITDLPSDTAKVGDFYTVRNKNNSEYAYLGGTSKSWLNIGVDVDYSELFNQITLLSNDLSAFERNTNDQIGIINNKINLVEANTYTKKEVDDKIAAIPGGGGSMQFFTDMIVLEEDYLMQMGHNYIILNSVGSNSLLLPEHPADGVIIFFNNSQRSFNLVIDNEHYTPVNQYNFVICTYFDGVWSANSQQFNHIL